MRTIKEINEELKTLLEEDEQRRKELIAEGGLSRIIMQIKDNNKTFGVVSAYRNENSKEENNKQTSNLTGDLTHMNLGFVKLEGGYLETVETDEEGLEPIVKPVVERSFFVGNLTKEQAMQLCSKYNQESVLFKDKDGLRYIDRNGKDVSPVFKEIIVDNDFLLTQIKDYFSRRLQGKNQRNYFKFDEIYVGIQNWKWGRSTISEYNNTETSDKYTDIQRLFNYSM